jgi:hypothetical protein
MEYTYASLAGTTRSATFLSQHTALFVLTDLPVHPMDSVYDTSLVHAQERPLVEFDIPKKSMQAAGPPLVLHGKDMQASISATGSRAGCQPSSQVVMTVISS